MNECGQTESSRDGPAKARCSCFQFLNLLKETFISTVFYLPTLSYLNQTWVCLPKHSKANQLTPSCRRHSIYQKVPSMGPSMENEQLMLKRWELLVTFREGF